MKTILFFLLFVTVAVLTVNKIFSQREETLEQKIAAGILKTFSNEHDQSSEKFLVEAGSNTRIEYEENGKVYVTIKDNNTPQFDITGIQQAHRILSLQKFFRK